jgi:aspartyl-tRNA(Asn)/glutamyl-tRNA(Gln) amidotransferase subunit A
MRAALEIAAAVRSRQTTALAVVEDCLQQLQQADGLCAITRVLVDRARQEAGQVDAAISLGLDPGPLAGVPYGVKDLFDVAGLATTAGSTIYAYAPPAVEDAQAIQRLSDAGAVLVATLNMDEFAYGFATINARHGTTRNPHDHARLAGGSSGGSAAVVAAGLLPFALGSDTNGSIRVPASLTGLYGLKPTHGALPMGGVFPFADSFDDIGPFTASLADMNALWAVLSGKSAEADTAPIRIARLGGRFRKNARAAQLDAIDAIVPGALLARADLGIHTQPISFLGLPSLAVPLLRPGQLPLGLQLIGRPGAEAKLFRCAAELEQAGFIGVTAPASALLGAET